MILLTRNKYVHGYFTSVREIAWITAITDPRWLYPVVVINIDYSLS